MAKATSPTTAPTDPVALLSTPLAGSGLAAGALLRRSGIKLDFYTVRDLLFHLPRRYDDLREMRSLGDLVWAGDGEVVSARARVGDVRVEAGFRGRTQRTIARLEDDTGSIDATWFGRRFIERRLHVGADVVVSGKIKHFGRRLTLDNPEFQVLAGEPGETELLHAGRIVPVYPLTAGLTAIRLRTAIREALDKAGLRLPGIPAGRRSRPRRAWCRSPARSRRRISRRRSQGVMQPSAAWPSTSCSPSSWAWSPGAASGSATRPRRSPSSRRPTARSARPSSRRSERGSASLSN